MKKPKVSVIIPVYNGEKTLIDCLNSVIDQSYGSYEIIIVDNNSTDGTKGIVFSFRKENKRIRYIFEKIRGRGSARNFGEKKATGEIILMTDADCVLPKNWIGEMIKPIIAGRADAVQGSEEAITKNYWSRHAEIRSLELKRKRNNSDILGNLDTKNLAILRSGLAKIGFTSRKYKSLIDFELSIRIRDAGLRVAYLDNAKVKHYFPESFFDSVKKHFARGIGSAIITKYYKNAIISQKAGASLKSFFRISELLEVINKHGMGYAFYDFVIGVAFRAGLVYGNLRGR